MIELIYNSIQISMKKSGIAGIFAASLELTREGILSVKKKF